MSFKTFWLAVAHHLILESWADTAVGGSSDGCSLATAAILTLWEIVVLRHVLWECYSAGGAQVQGQNIEEESQSCELSSCMHGSLLTVLRQLSG